MLTGSLRRFVVRGTVGAALFLFQAQILPAQDLHSRTQAPKQTETSASSDITTFKETVRRVILDVVVTDRSTRKPIHGLTEKDFGIVEDGKPQKILSFEEHNFDSDADFRLAKLPTLPPNTFINVPVGAERGPLYVLLLDLVNTAVADQPYARSQILKFINAKPEGSRFAVFVLSDKVQLVQGFTTDKSRLAATLDPNSPQLHVPRIFLYGDNFGRGQSSMMVGVFERLAHYLDGMPGRKNLVWFAGQFPFSIFPSRDDVQSYQDKVKDTLDTMARNQIALYTVDATCLPVIVAHAAAGDTGGGGVYSDFRSGGAGSPGGSAGSSSGGAGSSGGGVGFNMQNSQYMTEDAITEATGGHAYYSTNDLAGALLEATETGGSYYTFMYSPSNKDYDGRLRHIRVEMEKRGYELAYRRSYYGEDPDAPGKPLEREHLDAGDKAVATELDKSLVANIQHGAPMEHEILLKATLHAAGAPAMATPQQMEVLAAQPAFFHPHKGNAPSKPLAPVKIQTIDIDYTVLVPRMSGQPNGASLPTFEFAVVAYDVDGRILNSILQKSEAAQGSGDPVARQKGIYRVQQQIDVPSSARSIRVAARETSTNRMGTMEIPLPLAAMPSTQASVPDGPPSHPVLDTTKPN